VSCRPQSEVTRSAVESRFEALRAAAALTPLVGREEEIDLLLGRWHQATSREGQVVNRRAKLTPDWSGPLGVDKDQAADLTACRARWSSNCWGLR
jgi:hypothetical protein